MLWTSQISSLLSLWCSSLDSDMMTQLLGSGIALSLDSEISILILVFTQMSLTDKPDASKLPKEVPIDTLRLSFARSISERTSSNVSSIECHLISSKYISICLWTSQGRVKWNFLSLFLRFEKIFSRGLKVGVLGGRQKCLAWYSACRAVTGLQMAFLQSQWIWCISVMTIKVQSLPRCLSESKSRHCLRSYRQSFWFMRPSLAQQQQMPSIVAPTTADTQSFSASKFMRSLGGYLWFCWARERFTWQVSSSMYKMTLSGLCKQGRTMSAQTALICLYTGFDGRGLGERQEYPMTPRCLEMMDRLNLTWYTFYIQLESSIAVQKGMTLSAFEMYSSMIRLLLYLRFLYLQFTNTEGLIVLVYRNQRNLWRTVEQPRLSRELIYLMLKSGTYPQSFLRWNQAKRLFIYTSLSYVIVVLILRIIFFCLAIAFLFAFLFYLLALAFFLSSQASSKPSLGSQDSQELSDCIPSIEDSS